jgi:hypothetical protein
MFRRFDQVVGKVDQLLVLWVWVPFQDRDTIIDLEPKGVCKVVDDDGVFQILVLKDAKVLDEEPVLRFQAVASCQDAQNVFLLRI